mmetsp:Transcript_43133/g.90605  ORF Transcript_43133/g.90605 Transcript_43133/m.90605 type:complete len:232 (-) Transcript_43133:4636-5331(-)
MQSKSYRQAGGAYTLVAEEITMHELAILIFLGDVLSHRGIQFSGHPSRVWLHGTMRRSRRFHGTSIMERFRERATTVLPFFPIHHGNTSHNHTRRCNSSKELPPSKTTTTIHNHQRLPPPSRIPIPTPQQWNTLAHLRCIRYNVQKTPCGSQRAMDVHSDEPRKTIVRFAPTASRSRTILSIFHAQGVRNGVLCGKDMDHGNVPRRTTVFVSPPPPATIAVPSSSQCRWRG